MVAIVARARFLCGSASGIIVLMQEVRWLNPTAYEGRTFGDFLTFAWCAGLLVLALGVVRRHGSHFTLHTVVVVTVVIAVYLGLCQILSPVIPTCFGAAGLSAVMLYEASELRAS